MSQFEIIALKVSFWNSSRGVTGGGASILKKTPLSRYLRRGVADADATRVHDIEGYLVVVGREEGL